MWNRVKNENTQMHERSLSRTFWNAKEMQEKSLPGFQPENHYNEIHARNRQALWCSLRKISEYSFNIYILKCWNFIKILIRSFSAFYFSKTEIEKSHVDVVSVSNLKMAINFVTVPQTAALIKMAFVSNLKSQVRFFREKKFTKRNFESLISGYTVIHG